MTKKKNTSKMTRARKPPPPDPDADLNTWECAMLGEYVPNAASEAETRHVKMHIETTNHLAHELRAIRRALEGKP